MGNLDTKLTIATPSPYYIVSESNRNEYLNTDSNSIWLVKRANFNNECKNATLFEFNNNLNGKLDPKTSKQLTFAQNQIKTLKTLRHPNIVKYFYSEETSLLNHPTHFKCLLITEYIRPLTSILNELSSEQIIHGIYGLTQAVHFLHEKVLLSHNNINESCIYLNSKQAWKLNNFELAIPFSCLSKQTLTQIYDSKNKNSITPEEESTALNEPNKLDIDLVYKKSPHSIDAYGWAMCIINLLPSSASDQLEQLEIFLNKDPIQRPTFETALNLKLFDYNKLVSSMAQSFSSLSASSIKSSFDPYQIASLDDLELNYLNLVDHLAGLSDECLANEKLIDFLLSPLMFFSDKVRKTIFPSLLIPKDVSSSSIIDSFYSYSLNLSKETNCKLKPFLSLNNYKAFIIPRVLTLFSIHSTQIRIGLLEFFPFYAPHINDNDTLKFELLPELLVGLKDKNDDLVALTFSCLSVMVKLIGGQQVVGNNSNNKATERRTIFSDNLPKRQLNLPLLDASKKLNSFASLDEEMMLMMMKRGTDSLSVSESNQKLFSDSMIGLHDDTDTDNANGIKTNGYKTNEEDEWSNDFGVSWSSDQPDLSVATKNIDLPVKNQKTTVISDDLDQFDIKNIKLTSRMPSVDKKADDLIENFLNEMQPVIKKTTISLNEIGKNLNELNQSEKNQKDMILSPLKMVTTNGLNEHSGTNGTSWECEEIVDIEEN